MLVRQLTIAVFATVLSASSVCLAQLPGKFDLEAAEIVAELVGAPVLTADGPEIGQVSDVSIDREGRPERIRMTTGAILAFGLRTIELPQGAFTVLRGAVVLDLPAEAVQALPELAERDSDKSKGFRVIARSAPLRMQSLV
jgi:PRC-barrel domain